LHGTGPRAQRWQFEDFTAAARLARYFIYALHSLICLDDTFTPLKGFPYTASFVDKFGALCVKFEKDGRLLKKKGISSRERIGFVHSSLILSGANQISSKKQAVETGIAAVLARHSSMCWTSYFVHSH
jgi:hypothetical protein